MEYVTLTGGVKMPKLRYGVYQVALRYLMQSDVVVIPKSVKKERMAENLAVFDFTLSDADMAAISALDTNASLFFSHYDPDTVEWFMTFAK